MMNLCVGFKGKTKFLTACCHVLDLNPCLLKADIHLCYDGLLPQTRHKRHCAMPQTWLCHHRGEVVETFDLEIHKVNSMPLWLLFPCFICQHPSPPLKKQNNKKRKYSPLSYCLFKLACLPHSIPSTVSVRGLKARLVHCFTSETVCVFVSSGSPGEWNERDREGEKQHMEFMMNVRGDSTCFLWWWGSGGFWKTHRK